MQGQSSTYYHDRLPFNHEKAKLKASGSFTMLVELSTDLVELRTDVVFMKGENHIGWYSTMSETAAQFSQTNALHRAKTYTRP